MKKERVILTEQSIVGLSVQTNNQQEGSDKALIPAVYSQYFQQAPFTSQPGGDSASTRVAVYHSYASDHQGNYTFTLGEKHQADTVESPLSRVRLAAGEYMKFTTERGALPGIIIKAWQQIWTMNDSDFGGRRNYLTDFEVYDERATNPQDAVVDIYIGIKGE